MNVNIATFGLLAALILVLGAAAQTKAPPPDYEPTAERQADEGICYELMVKKLYAATDESDPLQEGYLRSAEAYRQLAQEHQRCQ